MAHSAQTSSTSEGEPAVNTPPPASQESFTNSDLLQDRIAAHEEAPRRLTTPPKDTNEPEPSTPIIYKSYASDCLYVAMEKPMKMTQAQIRVALRRELKDSLFNDVEDLVDNVFHRQTTRWSDMLERELTGTVKKGKRTVVEDKSYNESTRTWNNWPPTNTQRTEVELGEHLNAVAEIIRTHLGMPKSDSDLVFSPRYALCGKGTETDSTRVRKPDLVVLPRHLENVKDVSWDVLVAFVSLKIATGTEDEERMQLAEYARLAYFAQPDRRYVLCIGFRHTTLTLYVFDRAGVLSSRKYDVNEEPEQFLRIAIGILFLDKQALGYDPSFSVKDKKRFVKMGRSTFKISENLFLDRSIRGRGTVCLKANGTGRDSSSVYVVKDTWIDRSRAQKEVKILRLLRRRKVNNVPTVVLDGVVQVQDLKTNQCRDDNTDIFRGDDRFNVEIRDHYRIVMQPYGEPITKFSSLLELMHAMLDILQTIIDLDKAGIIHRDISLGNLVLVRVPGSTFRKGFIIDFDHAIEKNRKGRGIAEAERTGTLPYIAIDILRRYADHGADHDAESLLYILIWITISQAGVGGEFCLLPFEKWSMTILSEWAPAGDITLQQLWLISNSKKNTMENVVDFKFRIIKKMHESFHPLQPCLLQLRRALFPPQTEMVPKDDYATIDADDSESPAISRNKDTVLCEMKEAFKRSIKYLESQPTVVSSEPTSQGPTGSSTHTSADVPKTGERPQYAADYMPTHQMKLRNRLTDGEEAADPTPQAPVPEIPVRERRSSLRVQAIQNSYMEGQASLKRSRTFEDDSIGETSSQGSSAKKVKASTGSYDTNRPTRSMSSADKKNKSSTSSRTTRSMSSARKNLG